MIDINSLLSKLNKVRATSDSKWLACCPAHDDRNPSLAIKLTDDSKILIHCFAGCEVQDVLSSVGLTFADLMPDNPSYRKASEQPRFNKYELFDRLVFESTLLLLAIRRQHNGMTLKHEDIQRVLQAEKTIDDIAKECKYEFRR